MIQTINRFSDFIKDYEILKYRTTGKSYELVLIIIFIDLSELHVRDYLFLDGKRKYAFHYQDIDLKQIFRYDTAPHWKNSKTFPYHKHLKDNSIIDSKIMYLESVLNEIVKILREETR
ncbi:MAG: DUF6516 family protein [Bacteroidales bacterium]|nr:DUF6516 family protein [Bacteroidales bacterium]